MRPGMGLGRSNFAAAAVAGLLLLLLFLNSAYAQQSTPFLGQGYPPMYTNTTVYTSAIVDRLIAIDDQNYRSVSTCIAQLMCRSGLLVPFPPHLQHYFCDATAAKLCTFLRPFHQSK